jgi:FPC/CPF motif-containing protein YcgG
MQQFKRFVQDKMFPCVGAKSAIANDQVQFCIAGDIAAADSDDLILSQLQQFAQTSNPGSLFVSFAVLFTPNPDLTEADYERYLWQRLQSLHDKDAQTFDWDNTVSADPDSPDFSMSIGGKGFYVVGLHPNASRTARRFAMPVLIFNLHSQFELLRKDGSYERIRDVIIARDTRLHGTPNPMLAQHGQSSEARQYSGREVDASWKCPFIAHRRTAS